MKRWLIMLLFAFTIGAPAESKRSDISQWLVLGPLEIPASDIASLASADAMLNYPFLDVSSLRPAPGQAIEWMYGQRMTWKTVENPVFSAGKEWRIVYWALYLETSRWLKTQLIVEEVPPLRVFLDGAAVRMETVEKRASGWLTLENGKHLLVGLFLLHAEAETPVRPRWAIQNAEPFGNDGVVLSLSAARRIGVPQVLNTCNVNSLSLSPDGELAAVFLSQLAEGEKKPHSWMEILNTADGRRIFSSPVITANGFSWLKDPRRFAFLRQENDKFSICTYSLTDHQTRILLSGIENFSSCWWAPDGRFLVYSQFQKDADVGKGYNFVRDLPDRADWPKGRFSMTLFYPSSGVRHRLSETRENYSEAWIAPDNSRILLGKTEEDTSQRPYSKKVYALADPTTLRKEILLEDRWLDGVSWSPDSRYLLFRGGPSAFGGAGHVLKEGMTANEFDIQAFMLRLADRRLQALTRDFKPSVEEGFWSPADRMIYFKVMDEDCERIYRLSPEKMKFTLLETGVDALHLVSFSQRKTVLFYGSAPNLPPKLYVLDLASGSSRLLADFNRDLFASIRWGRVERLSFKLSPEKSIRATLYLPPDFDATRRYPCIVNYYGGTNPIEREYGGRYPREWYAANGYVVLVLQPSGAVGFGQENSALHVNDWGEITSKEILASVEEFLRTHPFVDPAGLGAIGASYGGFLTQYLATRTDRFAAFISHAGISSLASYWGVSDWGYGYGAIATADSFPWNRKDIYVGHSPLFMAERIQRPMLLLHGEDDNNVPPGESYQMFAALKLLGKEVALVTFSDQKHHILDPEKRQRWMATIIAWFDRWLKKQPEWWKELYPDRR